MQKTRLQKILAGGQTGVDRAALDTALNLGIEIGGWCPLGRLSESGEVPIEYPLVETESADPRQRTEWNVRDSQATLLLCDDDQLLDPGSVWTCECSLKLHKPLAIVEFSKVPNVVQILHWLAGRHIGILNVAGPKESFSPGIYENSLTFLHSLFVLLK